jgi:transposase
MKQKKRERRDGGFMELVWPPGDGQGDFGEADIEYRRRVRTIKYLCLSFSNSNAGFTQEFWGETAQCVCQGLRDIFHHIGGVPQRIVFDNASGIGRSIKDKISMVDLFLRFKCHYGFSVSFCNPDAGHEKGHIENKIGYVRRNFFVLIPALDGLEMWNRELLFRGKGISIGLITRRA